MTPEIWADIRTRLHNLRGDIIGQWQGDIDNAAIEQTVTMLGATLRTWDVAHPVKDAAEQLADQQAATVGEPGMLTASPSPDSK